MHTECDHDSYEMLNVRMNYGSVRLSETICGMRNTKKEKGKKRKQQNVDHEVDSELQRFVVKLKLCAFFFVHSIKNGTKLNGLLQYTQYSNTQVCIMYNRN